jgi:transposase InsO family protein
MCQRTQFIALHRSGLFTTSELCARFCVSRKTGYKWLERYEQGGLEGLQERSHATRSCPHKTAPEVEARLLAARQAHPSWGPKKLLAYTQRRHPDLALPAASTVGDLLRRSGLVAAKRRRKWGHPGSVALEASAPNQVWCADFKGQFKMGDGQYCFPLTVTDAHSRYLLACEAHLSTQARGAIATFERLFQELGLPAAIRTDNGVPFATPAIGGLSQLNLWWTMLDIAHQRIEPGKPQQNGRHERMHKTLKAEATRPAQKNLPAQQARFDAFCAEFNWERPHEAIGQRTPASLYVPSSRALPSQPPTPQYPEHFQVRLVRGRASATGVSGAGTFRLHGWQTHLSEVLSGQYIGLEEVDEGAWTIWFFERELARFDQKSGRLYH